MDKQTEKKVNDTVVLLAEFLNSTMTDEKVQDAIISIEKNTQRVDNKLETLSNKKTRTKQENNDYELLIIHGEILDTQKSILGYIEKTREKLNKLNTLVQVKNH